MLLYMYAMVCYAMLRYGIWTKAPPHTQEFQTFRSKIKLTKV